MNKIKIGIISCLSVMAATTVAVPTAIALSGPQPTPSPTPGPTPEPDIYKNCLKIQNEYECVFTFCISSDHGWIPNLQYSLNSGQTWKILTPHFESEIIWQANVNLSPHSTLLLRGNNPEGWTQKTNDVASLIFSTPVEIVSGNVMSLLDEGTGTIKDIPCEYCFHNLFDGENAQALVSVNKDLLPAVNLKPYCYAYMFSKCFYLMNPPDLPSTTLSVGCYYGMFYACHSLTNIQYLPANDLQPYCYFGMYCNCLGLTDLDVVLHAQNLAPYCYGQMFLKCERLKSVAKNMLPVLELHAACYGSMFQECIALTSPPDLPAMYLDDNCYNSMFFYCMSLTNPPKLPATNLAKNCYLKMFSNCYSLQNAPELPAKYLVDGCYNRIFQACTSLSHIKVGFTKWESKCTDRWVANSDDGKYIFPTTGTFECPSGLDTSTIDHDHCPKGWTVVKY